MSSSALVPVTQPGQHQLQTARVTGRSILTKHGIFSCGHSKLVPKDHQSRFGAIPECPQPPLGTIPERNGLEELLRSGLLHTNITWTARLNQTKPRKSLFFMNGRTYNQGLGTD